MYAVYQSWIARRTLRVCAGIEATSWGRFSSVVLEARGVL